VPLPISFLLVHVGMGGILLLSGGTHWLIEISIVEQCQVLMELRIESLLEQLHLLCNSVHMMTVVLCQVVELLNRHCQIPTIGLETPTAC
jgi:hypothetical protein